MSDRLGLIEMAFVFTLVVGWAVYELWSLRRPRRPAAPPTGDGEPRA